MGALVLALADRPLLIVFGVSALAWLAIGRVIALVTGG